MEWILNKKVYQKATFWQSIMVYAAEQALLTVCYMLFLIVAFVFVSMTFFRRFQLEQMEREIGVFMAQGYRKKKLSFFLPFYRYFCRYDSGC